MRYKPDHFTSSHSRPRLRMPQAPFHNHCARLAALYSAVRIITMVPIAAIQTVISKPHSFSINRTAFSLPIHSPPSPLHYLLNLSLHLSDLLLHPLLCLAYIIRPHPPTNIHGPKGLLLRTPRLFSMRASFLSSLVDLFLRVVPALLRRRGYR